MIKKEVLCTKAREMCEVIEELTGQPVVIMVRREDEIIVAWQYIASKKDARVIRQRNDALKQVVKERLGDDFIRFGNDFEVSFRYDKNEYPVEFRKMFFMEDAPVVETTETDVQRLFSDLFGTNIAQRVFKLMEEYKEFIDVVPMIFGKRIAECTDEQLHAVVDELSDVNAVVFHIAGLLGLSQWELLLLAYDKVKGRQENPNYKRTHPHDCEESPRRTVIDWVGAVSKGLAGISGERLRQLSLGRDEMHDNKENAAGELLDVAAALVKNDPDLFGSSGWSWDWWEKTTSKPEKERLAIAGALIAAEIDREEINRAAYEKEIAAHNDNNNK